MHSHAKALMPGFSLRPALATIGALAAFVAVSASMIIAPPAHAQTPSISNIQAAPTDTTAVITWNTDVAGTSQVAFGTSSTYNASSTQDTGLLTYHSATLTALSPGTTYHYQVISTDQSGNTARSADQTFTTTGGSTNGGPAVSLGSASGAPGTMLSVTGSGFGSTEIVSLSFNGSSGVISVGSVSTDSSGRFSTTVPVPSSASGNVTFTAGGSTSGRTASAAFTVGSSSGTGGTGSGGASLTTSISSGAPGSSIAVTGTGFSPNETVSLNFGGSSTGTVLANANGSFTTSVSVPSLAAGSVTITATGSSSGRSATDSFSVSGTTTGGTTTGSTDLATVQAEVTLLQNQVAALQQQVQQLMAGEHGGSSAGTGTSSDTTSSGASTTMMPPGDTLYTGSISDVSASGNGSFTLTAAGGTSYTVNLASGATVWDNARSAIPLSSFANGDSVRLDGALQSDGSITADVVRDTSK